MSIRALLTALAFVASTYFLLRRLIPLVTSIFSKQLSIRTISLTSVKGIHWQTTQSTDGVDRAVSLKVGRVGYVFHWYDRSRRARSWLTLTIEDVDVFIEETTAEPSSSAPPAASVPGSPFSSHPLGAHATPPGSILSSPQIFDSPDQRRPSGLLTPQFSPSPEDSSRPPSISNTSRPSLLSAATGGSAIFSPYAFSESAGGYFPDPSQASSPFYTQLKRRSKRLLRKALEKSLRSAFNATPGLAKLVDVEIVGDVKLKFFQRVQLDSEKEEVDQNGETIIQGFLASLKGKLRISTSVDLQAPDFNPHVSGHKSIVREGRVRRAQNQARWFRAIVNNVWKRGIGKSVGVGRIVLEIPNEGGIEIKAIEAPRGGPPDGVSEKRLKRASTFSSLGPKTSPSAYPEKLSPSTSPTPRRRRTSTSTSFELPFKRSTSFASLPSALLGSFGSKSIGAYTLDSSLPSILRSSNEPTVNEACRSMINLQGPLSLSVGHQFGPGIELIGEQTVIIEAGFDGKIAVGLNAVEAFVDERKRAKRLRESEFKARLEKMREKEKTAEESVEFTSEITLERNSKVDDANNKKNVKKQNFIKAFHLLQVRIPLVVVSYAELILEQNESPSTVFPNRQSFTVNHPFDSESDSENGSHIHNSSQTRILPLELALKGFLSTYRVSHIDTCALYRSYRGIQRPHDSESNRSIGCELQSAILSIGPWKKHHIYPWFGGQSLKPLIQIEGARINMYTNLLRLKKGFGSGKKPALFADDPNERLMVCESELKKFKGTAELEDLEALVLARKARRQLEKEQKAFDRATSSDFGHTYEEPPSDHMPEPPLPLFSLSRSIVSKFPRFACAASLGEVNLVLSAEGPDSVCRPAFVFECGGGSFAANGEHQGFVPKKSKKNTRPNSGHSSIRALPYASLFVFESAGSIKSMQISLRDTNPRALELDAFHDLPILSISSSHSTCKGRLHQVLESSSLPVSDGLALDDTTTMIDLIYTVGEVRGDLWDPSAIENLSQFMIPVEAFRQRLKRYSTPPQDSSPQDATDEASLFRRLPVGLCAHVSIESVTLVIAALDPNPSCQKGLLRGLFVKARPVWEYCYYQPQHVELASIKSSPTRTALHLPPDIAVQAAAFATDGASKKGGLAALIAMQSHDFSFRPIFNARSFASGHSTNTKLFTPYAAMFPVPEGKDAGLIAWDFQQVHRGQELKGDEESDGEKKEKKKSHTDSHPLGSADSSISDPFGLTAAEKSSTPLRIPLVESRLLLRTKLDTDIASEHTLSIDLGSISARINLSHLYCVMCAIDAIKSLKPSASSSLSQSTKLSFSESTSSCPPSRSPSPQSSLKALPFTLHVVLSSLHLDVDLPLGERIFVRLRNVSIGLSHPGEVSFDLDTALALVPSPRQRTKWEELFRLRKVRVAITRRGFQSDIAANIDGMRLRIPYSYKLSQLILNINITIKAVKHIILMFKESNMSLVLAPKVEGPKHVPNIHLKCNVVTFEAKDDPMETKLNLIWRVGLEEQQARLEREDAFEAKVRAIRSSKDHQPALAVNEMLNTSRWEFTDKHSVSIEDARNRLHMFNSTNWIRRHRNAVREQGRREDEALRRVYGPSRPDPRLPIDVLPPVRSAPMFRIMFSGVDLSLSALSLKPQELKDFLYERGNKLPHSTKFSLLVPLHIHWLLDSAKWVLRDYPIPLFNLPPLESSQHGLKKAFEFETDLVIGEELAEEGSYFWVPTVVIPPDLGAEGASSFQLSVAKTVMPVKTYAAPVIRVNTSSVTDFCWGASYQPGIQDLMKVIETLSHPPRDPSERMGFWDKLRLVLHWTIDISFFGPLHVHAKGSRNPYDIVEHGAGFVLAWTGKPRLMINQPNEERELVQIEADSLLFAIPDFRDLQDQKAMGNPDPDSDDDVNVEREYHPRSKKILRKICAKFTNGARVGWGFMIERTCGDECESCSGPPLQRKCRMFDFKPHYTVVMKTPEAIAKHHDPKTYDSFRGFRSNYIHASMSVVSPIRRRGIDKGEPGFLDGYNSFHFSPKGFAHFFAWWRLFGGNMTLPIRQGRLFPNSPPPSKKFGKAMATFKYRFDLSPLFISHLYRYESKADWESGEGSLLGLKVQLAHFQADLHQREEQRTVTNAKLNRTKKVLHKPFYAADVVLDNLDLRALFAHIKEPENSNVKLDESTFLDDKFSTQGAPLSDPIWFDFDDYVETDWRPSDRKPKVELHPLALCPRFTYTKRAGDCCLPRKDSEDSNQRSDSDPRQASKFGKEPSHLCFLGQFKSTLGVQTDFAEHRRKNLQDILDQYQGDDATKGRDFMADGVSAESEVSVQDSLKQKIAVLDRHIHELRESDKDEDFDEKPTFHVSGHNRQESAPLDAASPRHARFGNSYQAHFPRVTWSNHSRNIVLKYYYHARAWRGFEYHMSSLAVKFIREMTSTSSKHPDQPAANEPHKKPAAPPSPPPAMKIPTTQAAGAALTKGILNMISKEILTGSRSEEEELGPQQGQSQRTFIHRDGVAPTPDPWTGLTDDFEIEQSHHLSLIKPQIALCSVVDDDSAVVLAALSTEVQMYTVFDKQDMDDPVNAKVMRRTYTNMSSLQAFYPTKLSALSNQNRSSGFVPLEILLDSRLHNTDDFERVVSHTDAAIQYDKFNLLRLRNTTAKVLSKADLGAEHLQSHTDLVAVHVPRFGVIATPEQFASFYNVVNNLLLYQDPIQQAKNKKLQNFVYSFDHSNLSGTADVVQILQHRIRECQRMKADYQAHHDDTENSSFQAQLKAQAGQLAEELSLVFEAIAATQQVKDDQQRNNKSAVRFEATSTEIGWHLLSSEKNLLAKLTLKSPQYQNLSRVDGSTVNEFTVLDLQALNGHPEAVFPEALSRWFVDGKYHSVRMSPFIVAEWTILAPVGGISIVQHFGLRLHPVRLQIERKTGREMLNYFFQEKTHPKGYDNTTETEQPMAHSNPSMSSFASETSTDLAALNSHTAPRFSMHRTSPDGSSTVLSAPGENISSISLASSNTGVSHPRPFRSNSMASLTSQNESSSLASLSRADMPVSLTPSGSQKLSRPRSSQSLQKIATEREKHEQTQAEEMRVRASRNRTFIAIHIESTSFVLSYKGDKAKNITDLRDFRITSPALTFQNKTASFEDLVHEFKNQLIKAAWKQKGQLVQQIFTKTGNSARSPPSKGSTKKQSLKDKRSLPTRLSDNLGNGSFLDQPILRVSSPVSISSSSVESEPGQDQESPSSNSDSSSAYSGSGSVDHSGLGSGDSGGGNKTKAKFGGLLRQALHLPQDRKRVPNLNFASTTSFTSNVQGGSG